MNLFPKASGTRPRVACEIAPEGVVAARSEDAAGPLSEVARATLAEGAVAPSLKPGNIVDRVAVVTAVRRALEGVGLRPNGRGADVSLVIPDGAVRVLLLDFDALSNKLTEALPIVRFRLKKLLPFEAEDAMVSYQVLSQSRAGVRVLAVAIPRDVLSEYETAVREAGFEPGAVLPSTLAALPTVADEEPALVVNAGRDGITVAIVRSGMLLLHRSVDLQAPATTTATPANLPQALFEGTALPLVDRESSATEWAAQPPLPEHGHNPYADRLADEAAVQGPAGVTGFPLPSVLVGGAQSEYAAEGVREPGSIFASPYAAETVDAELNAELHNAILLAPISLGSLAEQGRTAQLEQLASSTRANYNAARASFSSEQPEEPNAHAGEEIAHAVSVALAYFEDTLATMPQHILSAGPLGADGLTYILREQGIMQENSLEVRELVGASALAPDTASAAVPRSTLAAVLGALRG